MLHNSGMKIKNTLFLLIPFLLVGCVSPSVTSETSSETISSNSGDNISSDELSSLENLSNEEISSEETNSELPSSEEISSEMSSETVSSETSSQVQEDTFCYEDFFNPTNDVRLTIRIHNNDALDCMSNGEDLYTQEIYSPMDLTVSINGEERQYNECGIRVKGNMSRQDSVNHFSSNGQINGGGHFKIAFNETFEDNDNYEPSDAAALKARRFGKAKKIDIKWNRNYDETFTKEAYASHILESEGLLAQKINLARVKFITDNDEKEFLYQVQEVIDEDFLKLRLPSSETKGDLYKCGWKNSDNLSLTSTASHLMGVEDKTQGLTYVYDLKTNKKKSTHQSLINLINVLSHNDYGRDDTYLKERLESVVDVNYFLKFAAMEWIIGNPDSMRYNYNNTYLYFNSSNSLLYPIMYDNDRCFGIINNWNALPSRWPTTTKDINGNWQANPLYCRTVCAANNDFPMVKQYQDTYLGYVQEYASKYLDNNKFNAFTNLFVNKDNTDGGNYTFLEYSNIMKQQITECMNERN